MIKNELDAEDILQNSFVDVFSKLYSFKHQSSIGAWIKRIVINNCINYLKKRRLEIAEWQPHFAETISIKEAEMPSLHYNVQSVNHAIQQLPDGYRVVFNLYMMEGYDHKEIGEILSISEATSKSQYSRAKKKVREILVTQSIR